MTSRVIRALALGLAFLWACAPPPSRKPLGPDATLLEGARLRLEELQTRRRRILVWYELAEGAAPAFPDLAVRFQARALDLAAGLLDPQADSLARMLRSSARGLARPEKSRILALAGDLENISHGAWPLGLAVKGLLPLEPALAALALDAALAVCEHNPDPAARDRDWAALAPLAARIDLGRARALAAGVADPRKRSRAWLGLARFTNASQDLARAAAAAEAATDLGDRALCLARAALACYPARPKRGGALMARAFQLAGTAPDPERAAWLQGQVAALTAQADPARGWALAGRTPGARGARFKALYQAGAAYLALDPAQGRRALEEALDQAQVFPMAYQRCKGYGLAVRAMAPLFRDRARWVLKMIPRQAVLTRAEARAALAAAGALTDLGRAEAQARDIRDPASRLEVLARLALIQSRKDPAKAAALADRVIVQASRWGALMPRRSLDGLWGLLAPARALALAQKLPEPRFRAEALLIQARALRARGRPAAAAWRLHLALENLAAMDRGRAGAKARLLGDLARRRSSADPTLSRGLFRLAARAVGDID